MSGQLSEKDSALVHAHLEECEECRLKLVEIAIEAQWKGPEKRQEPRIRVSFSGRLKLLDPVTSIGPPHDVRVIEISRGGLKIQTLRYLIPNTLVQVHFNGSATLGKVRFCIRSENGYTAGIERVQDFQSA